MNTRSASEMTICEGRKYGGGEGEAGILDCVISLLWSSLWQPYKTKEVASSFGR